jgi:hypothetical protein
MIIIAGTYAILLQPISINPRYLNFQQIQTEERRYFAQANDTTNLCYDGAVRLPSCNINGAKIVKMKGVSV